MQDSGHTLDWPGQTVEGIRSNGKKIYAKAFKAWLVDQATKPGVSVAGLALRAGINANQLRRWMLLTERRRTTLAPKVLPVVVSEVSVAKAMAAPMARAARVIEVEIGGAVVRVGDDIDEQHLRTVLRALRG